MIFYSLEASFNKTHDVYSEHEMHHHREVTNLCQSFAVSRITTHVLDLIQYHNYWELWQHIVMTVNQEPRNTNAPKSWCNIKTPKQYTAAWKHCTLKQAWCSSPHELRWRGSSQNLLVLRQDPRCWFPKFSQTVAATPRFQQKGSK